MRVIVGCKATELFCDNGPRGSYFTRVLEVEVQHGSETVRHALDLGRRPGAFATTMPGAEIVKTADDNTWIDVAILWGDGRSMQRRIDLVRGLVIDNQDDRGRLLLDTIRADPDDDNARLVYADWLVEQGDPERAELIHLQCGSRRNEPVASLRARDLIKEHAARWLGLAPLNLGERDWEIQRGFLSRIRFSTIEDMLAAVQSLHEQGPIPEISTAENDAKACVSPDLTTVAVHKVEVRAAAYRAAGFFTCKVFDVATRRELIPAITESEEITLTGAGVFPTPVWLPDGRLVFRYGDGRDRIVALPDPATRAGSQARKPRVVEEERARADERQVSAQTCVSLLSDIAPLEPSLISLIAIPDRLYLDGSRSFSSDVNRTAARLAGSLTCGFPLPPTNDLPDYGIQISSRGSNVFCTLVDRSRKIIACDSVSNMYVEGGSWWSFRNALEEAVETARAMTTRRERFDFIVCKDGLKVLGAKRPEPDATRRALIETLRHSATDWTDAVEELLQIPNGLQLRDHGNGRFFATRDDFAIESLCHPHFMHVRGHDDAYGVALFDTASKLMFVLADLRRRIVVREMLFCLHNRPPEESWNRIRVSIESALRAAASIGRDQIIAFDQMTRLVPWMQTR